MLEVNSEQQQRDQEVVGTYLDRRQEIAVSEWSARFDVAAARIDSLYTEFTPDVHPRARLLGKLLGAAGMAFVETQYGSDAATARLYSGSYETDVLATQHNALHSWNFMRNMFRYAVLINERDGPDEAGHLPYEDEFFMRVPHVAACHDGIMGNGRGHDERQAALSAGYLMMGIGDMLQPDEQSMAPVEATTWDEHNQRQLTYEGESFPLDRRAARVADLLSTHDRFGVYEGICVIQEDLTKLRYERVLTVEANRRGFDLRTASPEERLEFIDSSDAVRSQWCRLLAGQADFFQNFRLADPTVSNEFPGLSENVALMTDFNERYTGKPSGLTAVGILEEAKAYASVA